MREQDWIFPCYREFGAALWRGLPLQRYIDNMFGNANDTVEGPADAGPLHAAREAHFGSISSPIGTQITQAVGFAWAAKLQEGRRSSRIVYFGDGATSSNEFHNGMNFAGVFKTPTIFFCRNNGWAISVPDRAADGERDVRREGRRLRRPRRARATATTCFAVISVTRDARRARRARRGPDADRGDHLPPLGPLDERRSQGLPARGRGRGVAAARSDRAPAPLPRARAAAGPTPRQASVEAEIDAEIKAGHRRRREDAAAGARVDVRRRLSPSCPGTSPSSASTCCAARAPRH